MTRWMHSFYPVTGVSQMTAGLLSLLLLAVPTAVLAHAGHGDEFQSSSQPTQAMDTIQVDAETAGRLGLKVEAVSRQRLAFGIRTTGQIETLPNQRVEVTTPLKGTVIQLLVNPGAAVLAGQAVAIMSSPELVELRTMARDRRSEAIAALQQAEADLRLAQENYRQQQKIVVTDVQQARTELSFAQERFNQDRELLASGAIPRRTFLESETKLAEARAALAKAESRLQVSEATAQLQRARSSVEVAESRVTLSGETYQTRLRQLGSTAHPDGTITIAAPISGTVADREATPGESGEDAGKKIMTIVNDRRVQVSANIYEKDLPQVQLGQRLRLSVNGIPDRTFEGRISVVGSVVAGETRVIPVKAELDNPTGVLKPGMFAELEILTDRMATAVLTIPKSALVETNDKRTIVFVQNGNAFQPVEVELGRASGDLIEVKSGLFDGDRVVTQRAMQLYAQSLRGGGHAEAEHETPAPTMATAQNGLFPWWLVIPAGGAIGAVTFWTGMIWGKRRARSMAYPFTFQVAPQTVDDSVPAVLQESNRDRPAN